MQNTKSSNKNIILAIVISLSFLILWQYFYEAPRQEKAKLQSKEINKTQTLEKQEEITQRNISPKTEAFIPSTLALASSERIHFENAKIKGSINPVGLKIDSLELKNYDITLLSPAETREAYFAQFGFATNTEGLNIPNSKTVWNVSKIKENEILAEWKNNSGVRFLVQIKLDENYMFSITQKVVNNSASLIKISPFVRILRTEPLKEEATMISHEGFVYNFGKTFNELKYSKMNDKKRLNFIGEKELFWAGFTDKYWLTSFFFNNLICVSGNCFNAPSDVSLNHLRENGVNRYQVDFVTEEISINSGQDVTLPSKFFAGAKELKLLDYYASKGIEDDGKIYPFPNFDKTVDFGIFYFLTKPIFLLITFLNSFLHNFGFAIIMLTIIVKIILLPVATKSYISMGKMKALAPDVAKLRAEITDKMELNRRIMELYKERQINPLSGCLPIILQIPVFFALYKVLYISIEMRGAEFIWWIKDLSLKDPTSLFNLFGLLPYGVPSFLQIGVLPLLMGLTTYLQQSLSPKSADPTQNMIIKTMPFVLVFIFASFPAGIVLYWVVNNVFSILQQFYIEKIILPKHLKFKKI